MSMKQATAGLKAARAKGALSPQACALALTVLGVPVSSVGDDDRRQVARALKAAAAENEEVAQHLGALCALVLSPEEPAP